MPVKPEAYKWFEAIQDTGHKAALKRKVAEINREIFRLGENRREMALSAFGHTLAGQAFKRIEVAKDRLRFLNMFLNMFLSFYLHMTYIFINN